MKKIELLPCPFCGEIKSDNKIIYPEIIYLDCKKCGIESYIKEDMNENTDNTDS